MTYQQQKIARALRWVSAAAVWAVIFYSLYNVTVASFKTVRGSVIWAVSLVALCVWALRKGYEVSVQRKLEEHLDAEKLVVVVRLRQMVWAFEAHKGVNTWKDYLPFSSRWTGRPPKPSLDELEAMFVECEDVVGPFDVNIRMSLDRLIAAAPKEIAFDERMSERYIQAVKHVRPKDSDRVISNLVFLGLLYYREKAHKKSAEMLDLALDLQNLHSATVTGSRARRSTEQVLAWQKLAAIGHMLANNHDTAENRLRNLLPVLEEKNGVLDMEDGGTQQLMTTLLWVYMRQGQKAIKEGKDSALDDKALRYLRDALTVVSKLSLSRASNLKALGRLFIWMGDVSDGETAFKLANAIFEPNGCEGKACNRCGKNHGSAVAECNACAKEILVHDRWHFCMSCMDVDLCAECHAGGVEKREWENIEKFPRECAGHEFFEVRADEKEEGYSVDMWIGQVCKRLSAEIERRGEKKELAL